MDESVVDARVSSFRRHPGWQIVASLLFALLGSGLFRCACGYTDIVTLAVMIPVTIWALWALHCMAPRHYVVQFFWAIPAGLVAFLLAENLLYIFWFGHEPLFEFWDDEVKLTLASILRVAGVVLLVAGFVVAVMCDARVYDYSKRR